MKRYKICYQPIIGKFPGFNWIRLMPVAACIGGMFGYIPGAIAVTWTVQYLGQTYVSAISDLGQVAGTNNGIAFISGLGGGGATVSPLGGSWDGMNGYTAHNIILGINKFGQAVGNSTTETGGWQGFITSNNGTVATSLGSLIGPDTYGAEAYGINNAGQVVGWSYTSNNTRHAFITGANGVGMTDLGTLGGTWSEAYGINASGQVIGASETSSGQVHAFITGPNGVGMTDITPSISIPGIPFSANKVLWSYSRVINSSGQVAGNYFDSGENRHKLFITGANGIDIADLSVPYWEGSVTGITPTGKVLTSGWASGSIGNVFISGDNGELDGSIDLNRAVNLGALGITDRLIKGVGINSLGQIVAQGYNGNSYLLSPINAYKISTANAEPFSDRSVIAPAGSAIGTIQSLAGTAIITRRDGSKEAATTGVGIYLDDTVETDPNSSLEIVFLDNTVFPIHRNSKMVVDEFVYEPDPNGEGAVDVSVVRGAFAYTSRIVGKEDPTAVTNKIIAGGVGIRGDASQYINEEYLDVSVKMNVGSPVTLSTAVDVPDAAFDLSFQYIFLTETGTLDVFLDGHLLQSFSASADTVGLFQYASLNISDADLLALGVVKLAFTFDGPKGSQAIVDDIAMPGLLNGDFSHFDQLWSKDGPGTLELVATISEEKWAEISAVPEPETYAMMLAGLGLVGVATRRRHRQFAACEPANTFKG